MEHENNILINQQNTPAEIAETGAENTPRAVVKRLTSHTIDIKQKIFHVIQNIECLESTITITENYENSSVEIKPRSKEEKFDKSTIKTQLVGAKSVIFIVDSSSFAEEYSKEIIRGLESLYSKLFENSNELAPAIFAWDEYFDYINSMSSDKLKQFNENLDAIRSIKFSRKSNYCIMLDCLTDIIENSINSFSVVLISTSVDNVNSPESIFQGLEKLRQAVNKQHVDFHCIGVGSEHDVIILDNIANMSTGRGSYQFANNFNLVECVENLHHELTTPSMRIEVELTDSCEDNNQASKKLYKMKVDRANQTIKKGDDSEEITTQFTARLFGNISNKSSIDIIIAGGENQKISNYSAQDLRKTFNILDLDSNNEDNAINICRVIKLQMDTAASCLKYGMDVNAHMKFREEISEHAKNIENALNSIRPMFRRLDLSALQFLSNINKYQKTLAAQYNKELNIKPGNNIGHINVSSIDFANLISMSSLCDMKSMHELNNKEFNDLSFVDSHLTNAHKLILFKTGIMWRQYPKLVYGDQYNKSSVTDVDSDSIIDAKQYIREKLFPDIMGVSRKYENAILVSGVRHASASVPANETNTLMHKYFIKNNSPAIPNTNARKFPEEDFVYIDTYLQFCSLLSGDKSNPANESILRAIVNELYSFPGFDEETENFIINCAKAPSSEMKNIFNDFAFGANINSIVGFAQILLIGKPGAEKDDADVAAEIISKKIMSAALKLAHERMIIDKYGKEYKDNVINSLFKTMNVREDFYKHLIDSVGISSRNTSAKNFELQSQENIVRQLKNSGMKYMKTSGKRKPTIKELPLTTNAEKSNSLDYKKITRADLKKYAIAMSEFTTMQITAQQTNAHHMLERKYNKSYMRKEENTEGRTISAPVDIKFAVILAARIHNLSSLLYSDTKDYESEWKDIHYLYSRVTTYKNAQTVDSMIALFSKCVIKNYIDCEIKKIMKSREAMSKEERVLGFVKTDRILAAAGFLQGAFLGKDLSLYLGTLYETVMNGAVYVPLVKEKLSLIISGKLILEKTTGKILCKNEVDPATDNFIILVEDIGMNKTYKTSRNMHYSDQSRDTLKQSNAMINKYIIENMSITTPYWRLGKKKRQMITNMIQTLKS